MNNETFVYIEDCKNDTFRIINEINEKCYKLRDIYKEYLKEAVKKEEQMNSLDILFFQIELTEKDISNYTTLFQSFLSRMYGQYYKLYIKIIHDIKDLETQDVFKDFNIYYDFIPYDDIHEKTYDFESISRVHDSIKGIINLIDNYVSRQMYIIEDDEVRINKGINIKHLVYQKKHEIDNFIQKRDLFNSILSSHYEFQKKFFKRMLLKLKLLFLQIDTDIHFESVTYSEGVENNEEKIEKKLLQELDIMRSPIRKIKPPNLFLSFMRKILWLICFR
jgi:hypothetical protein